MGLPPQHFSISSNAVHMSGTTQLTTQLATFEKHIKPEKLTTIKLAGCNLRVTSSSEQMKDGLWHIQTSIFNLGAQTCLIQSKKMNLVKPLALSAGSVEGAGRGFSEGEPRLVDADISVGTPSTSLSATTASVYVAP
jgi:hypothetical protein